nr:response regulator transcription factor [Gemmobacter straminiformis]
MDDEPEMLEILETALVREGYSFTGAGNIATFQSLLAERNFDVCCIDLTLPDGNGLNVVRELRSQTEAGIIILTGRNGELDHVLGLEIGADDYVTKPFRPRELAARVNAVYRRTSGHALQKDAGLKAADFYPAANIDHEFDGYKVSSSARQIWSPDGVEIDLTTAEFSVLLALLEARGRVLSRDQIMTFAKGREWESYDRVIDGLVSRLRRKLPRMSEGSHSIRTVHGFGYMLV